MPKHHLIVVGFDEIVANKYLPCIATAIEEGSLDSYSVIDLESARATIEERVRAAVPKPSQAIYLPDVRDLGPEAEANVIDAAISRLRVPGLPTKVYIATEVQAHEAYLRYCVENDLDSLVEKPVLAPMVDGRFAPSRITATMEDLIRTAARSAARHSVMTLSRYHSIYNDEVIAALRERVERWSAPLTSFHLRAAGGVWNLQHEYETRDDHPYKHGYGMLMHGAYHYVDLAAQILSLNELVHPERQFTVEISSFGAFPYDQHLRLSQPTAERLGDDMPRWDETPADPFLFGETDVTSTFRLRDAGTGRTLTVGTLAFEQTTPSIRDWAELPASLYNKNGRTSSVDLEARLSTLYSTHVHCYDIPRGQSADRIDAFARVTTRANAALFPDETYVSTETFDGLFHSDSNRSLMEHWLRGTETRSTLADHLLPMKLTEALATSLRTPGRSVEFSWPRSVRPARPVSSCLAGSGKW
ncbi:hypothetical protein [Streptomyces sp. NPDC060194]|uniref:hypothetical protein n=1 Tax=Streptomyces sp. NPDC060194 TaxID=3347069 RepID=UPI00365B6F23